MASWCVQGLSKLICRTARPGPGCAEILFLKDQEKSGLLALDIAIERDLGAGRRHTATLGSPTAENPCVVVFQIASNQTCLQPWQVVTRLHARL